MQSGRWRPRPNGSWEQCGKARVFWSEDKDFNWRTVMRVASWASIAAVSTLLAGSAEAMPAPAPYRADLGIILAEGGCGPAFFRNAFGACVPYGGGGGVVVAPGFYGGGGGYYGGGWHGGGWHGGYYHGGGWHGGGYHGGGWHGGGWHGRRVPWRRRALSWGRRSFPRGRSPPVSRHTHRLEPEISGSSLTSILRSSRE